MRLSKCWRLLGRVVLRIENDCFVTELLRPVAGGVSEHDEPWVVESGNDDGNG